MNNQGLKKEFSKKISGYIIGAFGLVAGLAWNDAIRSLIEFLFPLKRETMLVKFIYALVITILVVAVSFLLIKFFERKDKKQNK